MKVSRLIPSKMRLIAGTVALVLSSVAMPAVWANEETDSLVTTGSGQTYQTSVEQFTEGELAPEDARQVSVLGSRILAHIHNAERALDSGNTKRATAELELAQSLARVVRELLPVTIVTTEVTDSDGKRVYRYVDRVQTDRLPIVEGLINVEIVRPIVEAKQEQAALQGFELAEANLVRTAVLLDLDYAERKINRALKALEENNSTQARVDLLSASSIGVRFVQNEVDHPLVEAQSALRLAERQVQDGRHAAARTNLQLARTNLEIYRTLVDETASDEVSDLLEEIATIEGELEGPGVAQHIREFWNRIATWFTAEPGQAQATTSSEDG